MQPATNDAKLINAMNAANLAVDAVGRAVTVGDTVLAVAGRKGTQGHVQRVSAGRLVVRRDDGLVALLHASSVVVLRPVSGGEG